ncbi:hypothetical protein EON83_25900 [bacterium]|nr:MAG: hypothetical protein EON83_25900 [bacterium]
MSTPHRKPLVFAGSSQKDLLAVPEEVRIVFGYALHLAQIGQKHTDAKVLKGYKGAGVLEVVDDYQTDTYRAVYTVRFEGNVYLLHCFQKKSKRGSELPREDKELINKRLAWAEEHWKANQDNKKG